MLGSRGQVTAVRRLLAHRQLAVLICAAALLLKLLVPTGYMIASVDGRIAMTLCPGVMPPPAPTMPATPGMHGAMPEHGGAGHGTPKDHGKAELPCAFTGLSAATLGAVYPVQLAALIAFVMGVALVGVLLRAPFPPRHLRPPLRGPPAHA